MFTFEFIYKANSDGILPFYANISDRNNYEYIDIELQVPGVFVEDRYIAHLLTHELLHPISQYHEKANEQFKLIQRWNRHLDRAIEKNRKLLESGLKEIRIRLPQVGVENFDNKIKEKIQRFYRRGVRIFWNHVDDTALGIIAIELGLNQYIEVCNVGDRTLLNRLDSELGYIDEYLREHMLPYENFSVNYKGFVNAILKLLQFITCYEFMPYHGIAWGVLSHSQEWASHHPYARLKDNNTSYQIIVEFEAIVRKECDPEVAEHFLEFYHAYLDIVRAGAIRNNPLDPNIKKEIYDTGCLKNASRAYRLLQKGFGKFIRELNETKL
jgi:hypothetical protein